MRYQILGPVAVHRAGVELPLGGPKPRAVLAALLLDANRVVSEERLIALVWGDEPPPSVRGQLQVHISGLRKLLGAAVIERRPPGYLIGVHPGELDLDEVDAAVTKARADASADRPGAAAAHLRAALALWPGPALGGATEPLLAHAGPGLRERRVSLLEELYDAELAAGRHHDVVGELRGAARENPFRERLHAQLMLALFRSGQTAEALHVYGDVRERLAAELGTEPGPLLRRAHVRILRGDGPAATVPRQLPADLATFIGRETELSTLDALLRRPGGGRIAAIAGTAGVGKTTLAVHWAHRVRARFPDGQLYLNLRGFDPGGTAMTTGEAVRALLDALTVPAERIPASHEAQIGLYRSTLADRRALVVLDNARDAEQVRPLLPGASGCLAIVTSRADLTSLIAAESAQPLALDLLTAREARELLARRLGGDRLAREPDAVDEIVARSARLPLALAIVAARAASHPGFPLRAIAAELSELDAFDGGAPATDVRSILTASYRTLGPVAARVFRLLGVHRGPDITAAATASLAGLPLPATRRALTELARTHLITEHAPGRYALHDLLRGYAAELAELTDNAPDRRAALHRTLDHYLHTARAADRLLAPGRASIALADPVPGVTAEVLVDARHALAWFDAEHPVLVELVRRAPAEFDTGVWQLVWALATFFDRRGRWSDYTASHRAALDAARRLADPVAQAHTHRGLARAYGRMGHYADALFHLREALDRYTTTGDRIGQADIHGNLSSILERQGHHAEALGHAREALRVYEQAGDKAMQANARNTVGWLCALLGDHDEALRHCEQALTLLQAIDDRYGEAVTWDSLGYIHHARGDHARAVDAYGQALAGLREVGDQPNEARTLANLGDTHRAAGRPDAARRAWQRAVDILDELGHSATDEIRAKLDQDAESH
ncbi:AfsR/SARP family transcriptional regulator [Phytohabitans aurantiacus]|uniref:SARP family transcriptional regulator n=1 Tax=Phytohabitans aurantiacus TaxID=3016789 RepID=A0ABQ5R1J7_9ACTN|nr:BTAD domain-containing putative transcriptional regulator [Phytohabitans aurantiacus]GLI00570.1 SARP family transcriptional regulator [Phytohabitans aurantiacus]